MIKKGFNHYVNFYKKKRFKIILKLKVRIQKELLTLNFPTS